MTLLEAIDNRRSRRLYLSIPIESEKINILQHLMDAYNLSSGLSIQLVEDGSAAFSKLRKSYGLFGGVRSLLALVGPKSDPDLKEKAGYYGERLILEAIRLGLDACWVGGTFDRQSEIVSVSEEEELVCVITIGYSEELSFKEKMIHQLVAGKSKKIGEMLISEVKVPAWVNDGLVAVQKAPSAVNHQPVHFVYKDAELKAWVKDDGKFNLVDFGIAKAHFEVVVGGRFELGRGGRFIKD